MTDFQQQGMIATLQKIGNRPVERIEEELMRFRKKTRMVLLLPALESEFNSPSMVGIIDELMNVGYLDRIVLSLDRASSDRFREIKKRMAVLPSRVAIVWHDGPRMQRLYDELRGGDFKLDVPGKGRSVWMTIGYILADPDVEAIALHDTDILNYNREMLARLLYPVVHPALDFEFSKGYYARATDRLFGRVTRIFYQPLINALRRITGDSPFLTYLGSFRYALSGEFAMLCSLARSIRISPTWGLEVSLLNEVYQRTSPRRICQVEIAETYEHKHRPIDREKTDTGLIRMATDIAEAMLRVMSQDGMVLSQAFFRTLAIAYIEESRIAIEKYHALSLLNGLTYDRHAEIEATEAFVDCLKKASRKFVTDPVGIPMLSAWVRILAAVPDFQERLEEAVALDNAD
ncbi:MAG: glycosyl transferase [Thermodesulfobacteriota bacterium]